MIELNDELRQAVSEHPGEPIRLVDASSKETFVLLREEVFNRIKGLLYDDSEFNVAEAYPLMDAVLGKAGWNDPSMDIYGDLAPKEPS